MFYLTITACPWRNLPQDFAPWRTVYHYFRCWKRNGLWAQIPTHLREHLRQVGGRQRQPSAGIIDSQRVKGYRVQRRAGLRCGQASQRAQTACSGGYPGTHPASRRVAGEPPRPRRGAATTGRVLWPNCPAPGQTHLGRWRVRGSTGGLGAPTLALHPGDRETIGVAHVSGSAPAMGGGAHLRVVGALSPMESRLRTPSPKR